MASQKPSIPKGTRDFSPTEMCRRNYIFDTIRSVFQKYGFLPIETPAIENLSTLLGKYGEEGDKLLFRILNSGNFLQGIEPGELSIDNISGVSSNIAKKGLRYDLTVPFARYVVQHRNEITFPFRRYQIQPVWRADNPQKGRYREFFQCDVDIIGSTSPVNEFELIRIIDEVFTKLSLDVTIKINNRKVLAGIAEIIGETERLVDITVAIDKIDNTGKSAVLDELRQKGVSEQSLQRLDPIFSMKGSNSEKLDFLKQYLSASEIGMQGVGELTSLLDLITAVPSQAFVEVDITLARGLNYYTGAIIEVKSNEMKIGSVCGGGRYDNLTGIFGLPDVSGVGISFGADRIYDVLLNQEKFPASTDENTRVMFVNFGEKEVRYILPLLGKLRDEGIKAEIYPDNARMKKQMTYADNLKIPFVVLIGEDEIKENKMTVKNMHTGEQSSWSFNELLKFLKG